MIAHHFERRGCGVGLKFVHYGTLQKYYVCNWCGGVIVHGFDEAGDWARCGQCGMANFIPVWLFEKQVVDGPQIVKTLPPETQALFKSIAPVSFDQAMDELFN